MTRPDGLDKDSLAGCKKCVHPRDLLIRDLRSAGKGGPSVKVVPLALFRTLMR